MDYQLSVNTIGLRNDMKLKQNSRSPPLLKRRDELRNREENTKGSDYRYY